MSTIITTKFKRKVRKLNRERLVSIPPEIVGAFKAGQPIFLTFDGEKIVLEER